MGSPNVEDLDDEELLLLYDTTKKLLDERAREENPSSNKKVFLQEKLQNIEDELKVRDLWEGD